MRYGFRVMASHRFVYLLTRARAALVQRLDRECSERLGVTAAQAAGLLVLSADDGLRSSDFARALHLDNAAITRLVARLEAKRLVEQRTDRHDRRVRRVHLTRAGRACASRARRTQGSFDLELQRGFTEAELAIVARFLAHVVELAGGEPLDDGD